MPVRPEITQTADELPEARDAFMVLAQHEQKNGPHPLSGLGGKAIPRQMYSTCLYGRVQKRIRNEQERVLSARFGNELSQGIDPNPDPIARAYLETIGAIDPSEHIDIPGTGEESINY